MQITGNMEQKQDYLELSGSELRTIRGGAPLSDFGEWLTDKLASAYCYFSKAEYNNSKPMYNWKGNANWR